ncbi:hypothetical protein ATB99_02625 [Elizabethkingia meningoseptica]|nr:hypothetical protein BBD33_08495 [Elizabethkingia meningoseptica]AQX47325.1 hypothetical protein B5G46_08485 [Elizabethkingia meningoseptica]KUY24411.1 hypothetical protein ATB99_02625 [Elizabethkingia meningoseptica]OPB76366.1 hypothetical protein BAY30_16020 [Elizabethkingia meningoseptica]
MLFKKKDRRVTEPEDYYFSSAWNYADLDSVIGVEVGLWAKGIKSRITNPRHQCIAIDVKAKNKLFYF